jgi:hypothetical protein
MDMHDVGPAPAKQSDEGDDPPRVVDAPPAEPAATPQDQLEPEFSAKIGIEGRDELGDPFDSIRALGLRDQINAMPHLGKASNPRRDMDALGVADRANGQSPARGAD